MEIREEQAGDFPGIRDVNVGAFGQPQEAALVDALREHGAVMLSLVALVDGHLVGHILYSRASIGAVSGAALGPMAVLPEHQRRGIGSALVRAGNGRLRAAGCPFIVVVGHADFYPRFGFEPAHVHGITCEWNVPDDVFMALLLDREAMRGVSGLVKYRPEFASLS